MLLCLAVRLKYLGISDVPCRFTTNASLVRPHEVWKVHTYPSAVPNYTLAVSVPSRSSAAAAQIEDDLNASKGLPQPAVVQVLDEMQLAPLLEVSKYSWLLGLSAHDEVLLRSYMRWMVGGRCRLQRCRAARSTSCSTFGVIVGSFACVDTLEQCQDTRCLSFKTNDHLPTGGKLPCRFCKDSAQNFRLIARALRGRRGQP